VVHPITQIPRPGLSFATEPRTTSIAPPRRLGPFDVIDTIGRTDVGTLLLGFDSRLRRRVWLHQLPVNAPSVSSRIRDLNRPGRLRWLGGQRTSNESWDAYEALDGVPLVNMLSAPCPWRVVRQWLADLAREVDAALADRSLGHLTVDRVWITREGHAKLLDFQPPGISHAALSRMPNSAVSAQIFLSEVATSALAATTSASPGDRRLPRRALPVSASALLDNLAGGGVEHWSAVVERTTTLLNGADRVARRRRAATVALCAAMPVAWALFVGMMSMLMYRTQG
jgi:hypothetical protein